MPGIGILDFLFPGFDIPDAPGRDDFQMRIQRFDGQFKPHLIVSFSGGTVADGNSAFLFGNFHQPLCNHRTGERGAKQIFFLIYGAGL